MSINRVIKTLIVADVFLLTGIGLVSPIFAIFLTDRIKGGNVEVAGFAAAVYFIVEALAVIPFGRYLDRNHGEKDDLIFIMVGNVLAALAVLGFMFSSLPWHIYLLEALYALGISMNIPAYAAIFTRHIDKDREALEWSIRSSLVAAGTGVAGAVGGVIARYFGFNTLFIGVAGLLIISSFIPLVIKKQLIPKSKKAPRTELFRKEPR